MTLEATPAADPTYRYLVTVSPEDGPVRFNSVSGLELSAAIEHKDRIGDWYQEPVKGTQVTLRRGEPGSVNGLWAKWVNGIHDLDRLNITVSLLDESGKNLVTWSLADAFPVRSSASDRDGDGIYEFEELALLVGRTTVAFH